MRLWSLHPRYLDPQGLVALWREGLLAQKVLLGATKGYRFHPQLQRFRDASDPVAAVSAYLRGVAAEASERGYRFDESKLASAATLPRLPVTSGQLAYEWRHLQGKLERRNPVVHAQNLKTELPEPHPLFVVVPGTVEAWERR